jgi:hypothetical protein
MGQQTLSSALLFDLVPFETWLTSLGLDRSTGYRYRQRGILTTVNIFGRLYITRDEIARFKKRALPGEFSQKHRSRFVRGDESTDKTASRQANPGSCIPRGGVRKISSKKCLYRTVWASLAAFL